MLWFESILMFTSIKAISIPVSTLRYSGFYLSWLWMRFQLTSCVLSKGFTSVNGASRRINSSDPLLLEYVLPQFPGSIAFAFGLLSAVLLKKDLPKTLPSTSDLFRFTGFFFVKFLSLSLNDYLYWTREFLKFTHYVPMALLKLKDFSFIKVLADFSVFNSVIPDIWLIVKSSLL